MSLALRLTFPAVLAAVVLIATGCNNPPPPSLLEEKHGLVLVFPGVGTGPREFSLAVEGLKAGGVRQAVVVMPWNTPTKNLFRHLQDYDRNRRHAQDVAGRIAEYRARRPDAPIDLVGYSGGGGVALFVAEALPDDVRLRNIVLVQPGISPTYDLSQALQRLDGTLVNLYSPSDVFILGLGTLVHGTVDRAHAMSAGQAGFDLSRAAPDERDRRRVRQISWDATWLRHGHLGDHGGLMWREWNRGVVAPLVAPPDASSARTPPASRSGGGSARSTPPL